MSDQNTQYTATTATPIFVGSRSPRRLELLSSIVEPGRLIVLPPENSDEPDFDGLRTMSEFEVRCHEIVALKREDVIRQLSNNHIPTESCVVICADTTVIVEDSSGVLLALGQPATDGDWQEEVRGWFRNYLAGRTHAVMSVVSVSLLDQTRHNCRTLSQACVTRVTMRPDANLWLDWYVSTGEPVGKAGGYAIQGAGSVMVTKVEGSYSNVVGLPLEETMELLRELESLG
ncbi:MAG: Maf family protein [Rhodopirellula sp.]|nr:Maf family protein [Rhodopirellula sp.]